MQRKLQVADIFDKDRLINTLTGNGFEIYDAICHSSNISSVKGRLEVNPNYNATISCLEIKPDFGHYNQLQVSVYGSQDIERFSSYQKLFLIKDYNSLDKAFGYMSIYDTKLHHIIAQEFLNSLPENKQKEVLAQIVKVFSGAKSGHTLDSCFRSWIINGHCPYDYNYVDINYDGAIRKCPYIPHISNTLRGTNPNFLVESLNSIMKEKSKETCVYTKLFKGINDENTSIQNPNSNNRFGAGSKHRGRFSLRS